MTGGYLGEGPSEVWWRDLLAVTAFAPCSLKTTHRVVFLTLQALLGFKSRQIHTKKFPKRTEVHFGNLVRVTGLEPVRQRHTPLKRACLPVPAHSQILSFLIKPKYYIKTAGTCQPLFYVFSSNFVYSLPKSSSANQTFSTVKRFPLK